MIFMLQQLEFSGLTGPAAIFIQAMEEACNYLLAAGRTINSDGENNSEVNSKGRKKVLPFRLSVLEKV